MGKTVVVAGAVEGIDVEFQDNDITSISIGQNILERGVKNVFPESCSTIEQLRVIGFVWHLYEDWLQENRTAPYLGNLKEVFLERVEVIEQDSFSCNRKLHTIRMPRTLSIIQQNAFSDYDFQENTYLKLSSIQTVIFEDVAAWCNVVLDSNVQQQYWLLSNPCYSMSDNGRIINEKTNTEIKSLDNSNIQGVEEIAPGVFVNCKSLTNLDLPKSVKSIGAYSFWDCSNITTISFGENFNKIEDHALKGCERLTSMTFAGNQPSVGEGAFDGIPSTCTVHIKDGTTDWEIVNNTWKGFPVVKYS